MAIRANLTSSRKGKKTPPTKPQTFQVAMKIQTGGKFPHFEQKWSFGSIFFLFRPCDFWVPSWIFQGVDWDSGARKLFRTSFFCDKAKSWPPGVGRCLAAWPSLPRQLLEENVLYFVEEAQIYGSWVERAWWNIWPKKLQMMDSLKKTIWKICDWDSVFFEHSFELWSNLCLGCFHCKKDPLNCQPKSAKSSNFKRFIYLRSSKTSMFQLNGSQPQPFFNENNHRFFKTHLQWFDAQFDMQTWKENNNQPTADWRLESTLEIGKKTPTRPFWDININEPWICWVFFGDF